MQNIAHNRDFETGKIRLVTANEDRVTVARGLLFASRLREYDARSMTGVRVKVGMQSGNTPFYQVVFVRNGGKQVQAGWGIRDKREAEWLARRMRAAVGLATGGDEADASVDVLEEARL